jgi:pimeloyl-ACP methyl ester carboxylesterase
MWRTSIVLAVCLLYRPAYAQTANAEEVAFFTTDHVELVGTFFPSAKAGKSPCVLLLHRIGGSRKDAGCETLAQALQKTGYAVLSFDFRGHGESTAVSDGFWYLPNHKGMKNSSGNRQRLSHDDFSRTTHFASLVNDIAAAKHLLDLKSREGACDSSAVVVIGTDTGATLGALWVASEWTRWRTMKDMNGKSVKQGLEGHDIACAVWLNIRPYLHGRHNVPVDDWLGSPVRERVPMGFLYAANDSAASAFSNELLDKLKPVGRGENNLTGGQGVEVPNGVELLNSPGLDKTILHYLDMVLKQRKQIVRGKSALETPPPPIALEQFGIR